MGNIRRIRVASTAALLGGMFSVTGMVAGPAGADPGQTLHGGGVTFNFGDPMATPPPAFSLNPFGPPSIWFNSSFPVAGCPASFGADAQFVTTGGNAELHTSNNQKTGFWTGGTAEGPANLENGTGHTLYTGHLSIWGGLGTNQGPLDATGQLEQGEQFHFDGVSNDQYATPIRIDISFHMTMNNSGAMTTFNEGISCT